MSGHDFEMVVLLAKLGVGLELRRKRTNIKDNVVLFMVGTIVLFQNLVALLNDLTGACVETLNLVNRHAGVLNIAAHVRLNRVNHEVQVMALNEI